MESQITYNLEATLTVPPDVPLASIKVEIEVVPSDASCLIYGWNAEGNLQPVEVTGGKGVVDLPFAKPQIFVKYLHGLKHVSVRTLGWRERR